MSIDQIKLLWLRRCVLILALPIIYPVALLIEALIGIKEGIAYYNSLIVETWRK